MFDWVAGFSQSDGGGLRALQNRGDVLCMLLVLIGRVMTGVLLFGSMCGEKGSQCP